MAVLSLTRKSPYVDKTVFILRRGPESLSDAFLACAAALWLAAVNFSVYYALLSF